MNEAGFDMDAAVSSASGLISSWGLRVIGAIALLIVGWMACKVARSFARRTLTRAEVDDTLVPFLSNLVYYVLLVCVMVAVLGLVGIQTASLITVVGAAGLAIGLALQGTLSSFAAGVMLLIFRPFKLGDFVEVAGDSGSVKEISLFSTALDTPDNVRVVIPNSAVWGARIKNYAVNEIRRIDLVMGVSYDDDLSKTEEIIRAAIAADSRVLKDPEPTIAVSELADSSVNFVVRPWCARDDYWSVRFDLTRRMKEMLEAGGCSIPYPQTDVHLHQPDKGQAA